jgi:hypothetical protein
VCPRQRHRASEGIAAHRAVAAAADIEAEIRTVAGQETRAAHALERLGFRVLHVGPTISVVGREDLWTRFFNVQFAASTKNVDPLADASLSYRVPLSSRPRIPTRFKDLIAEVYFVEPPDYFEEGFSSDP